ncbi:MAG: peptidyl-tRNA hydrolase [Candidatus Izimaplasma bacterium HR2]|nr:MAG: peptidyl-tRNA hydrolase [Candidatus Izimaplasma bacterium HR2]
MKVKQVIVARKDLNMSPGKLAAQVSHASLGALLDEIRESRTDTIFKLKEKSAAYKWLAEDFTKIVLQVNSEEELLALYKIAKSKGMSCALIVDDGRTEVEPGTATCLGIGPDFNCDIDEITGHLKLYK